MVSRRQYIAGITGSIATVFVGYRYKPWKNDISLPTEEGDNNTTKISQTTNENNRFEIGEEEYVTKFKTNIDTKSQSTVRIVGLTNDTNITLVDSKSDAQAESLHDLTVGEYRIDSIGNPNSWEVEITHYTNPPTPGEFTDKLPFTINGSTTKIIGPIGITDKEIYEFTLSAGSQTQSNTSVYLTDIFGRNKRQILSTSPPEETTDNTSITMRGGGFIEISGQAEWKLEIRLSTPT